MDSKKSGKFIHKLIVYIFFITGIAVIPTIGFCEEGKPFLPYIETHPNGWVDWEEGMVYGVGKGYLRLNGNSGARAQRAARIIALQSILKVAADIRLDDQKKLEQLGKGRIVIELKGLVRSTEHKSSFIPDGEPHYEMILKTPLNGIEGLTSRLLTHLQTTTTTYDWKDYPNKNEVADEISDKEPWLVLDARSLRGYNRVNPALFPKIISEKGETIYELNKVQESALTKRGMASYVVTDKTKYQIQTSANGLSPSFLRKLKAFLEVRTAHADDQKKEKKKKRRRFILNEVKNAEGLMNTNLIISEKDAQDLTLEDKSSQILKKCRVIVVVRSPIGGIEGNIHNLYAVTNP